MHVFYCYSLLSLCAGDLFSLISKLLGQSKDVVLIDKYRPSEMFRAQAELVAQIRNIMQNKELGSPSGKLVYKTRENPSLVRDRVHKFHQLEAMAKPPRSKLLAEGQGGSSKCCLHHLLPSLFSFVKFSIPKLYRSLFISVWAFPKRNIKLQLYCVWLLCTPSLCHLYTHPILIHKLLVCFYWRL